MANKEAEMTDSKRSGCGMCAFPIADRLCRVEDGKAPPFCPTQNHPSLTERSRKEYSECEDIREFARQASIQEGEGYGQREKGYALLRPVKTRIEEIMEFSKRMGYQRLGLAFCVGLRQEARSVEKLFRDRGFDVISVMCKVGRVDKELIGVTKEQQINYAATEAMCNPILQAMILNEEHAEFNVLLGLCVGHDSLFFKYATAPCTVLAVKDRLLGHNPLAAIYLQDSYYRSIKNRE